MFFIIFFPLPEFILKVVSFFDNLNNKYFGINIPFDSRVSYSLFTPPASIASYPSKFNESLNKSILFILNLSLKYSLLYINFFIS